MERTRTNKTRFLGWDVYLLSESETFLYIEKKAYKAYILCVRLCEMYV